jgi:hypothetical protein
MLGDLNIWLVYGGTAALFVLSAGIGYRLGQAPRQAGTEASDGTTLGGLLGVLGLLIAFTFSMAVARYENRKVLLLDEANAIGTAWLRAGLLPDPLRTEARGLFRDYVDLRLELARTGKAQEAIARSERIQGELWSRVERLAGQDRSPVAALFVQSVNEVIDMQGKRVTLALRNTLPPSILSTLYAVAILTLVVMGFESGHRRLLSSLPAVALTVTLAMVVALIVDLDRPREGFMQVSQQAMVDLRAGMGP